jgi:pyruvate dehydrogenase E2 component (dihydrolipoamide acetyltransferase)
MQVFRLPDLGEGLTEAALVKWLVSVGDVVRVDQPIAEVETAKSVVEVPSPYAGTVAVLHGAEGETLAVGVPLVEVEAGASEIAPSSLESDAYRAEERAGSGNVLIGYGTSEAKGAGRTRRRRGSSGAAPAVAAVPVAAPSGTGPLAVRSPIVRRLAQERGVDLHRVTPTGPEGVITRADVMGAAGGSASARPASTAQPMTARTEPLSMLRKAVGAKMSRSRAEIPEATVWVEVDATDLWNMRRSMAGDAALAGPAPSLTAIIASYVVTALQEFPVLATRITPDGGSLEYFDGIHLGVAADTERGLMVPVVRNAEAMSIAGLDAAIRELAELARTGAASPEQLTGSTFTLNNYGSLGVDGSAAIINHPEVAILGIGRFIERPWVVDGAIVPRRITQLALVFDHRVCDGGYAAGFLRAVVDAIEHPFRRFAEL